LKLERYEEALKDFQFIAAAYPGEARPHLLLAQAFRALGQTAEAQAEMRAFGTLEEQARAAKATHVKEVLQNKEAPPTP